MFDLKAATNLTLNNEDGSAKKIVVRSPTDAEFIAWRRKKKVIQKDLGRGEYKIDPSVPGAADLELLAAIRLDEDGPAVNEKEAAFILGRLAECEVSTQPERDGAAFRIKMRVQRKFTVYHTLRIPSVAEMMDHDRARSSVTFGKYGQEIRINFSASAELYDKLKVSVEGYANNQVPVPHKAEAISVLLQEVRSDEEEPTEEDLD